MRSLDPQSKRRGPRKSDARLNQIVETAAQCFATNGYDATSLQDIAVVVGIRKSSLYAHVASKQELLIKILDSYITDMLAQANVIYKIDVSATEKLSAIIRMLYSAIERYRAHVTVFFEEMRYLEKPEFVAIREKREEFERILVRVIQDGVRQGEFVQFNARIVTFLAVGVVTWSYRWFNPHGSMSVDEITKMTMSILMTGIQQPHE
jgi:AcrR family transcriptional regulator